MISATTSARRRVPARPCAAGALLATSVAVFAASLASAEGEPFGRVVALRGDAHATAPDGTRRSLSCNAPIYAGDEISTGKDAGLGVLSGDFYARLGGDSELRFARTRAGTPDLGLGAGHLRLLDAGAEGAPVGRIVTPGLAARQASRDTEALVLREKISLVSMICGWDGGLDVSRVGGPDETAHPASGQCAVVKPQEPIFTTRASHDKLPIMDEAACPAPDALALGSLADRFTPYDVAAMLPPVDAAGPILMPNVLPPNVAQREPCTIGVSCVVAPGFVVTPPPVLPPPGPPLIVGPPGANLGGQP